MFPKRISRFPTVSQDATSLWSYGTRDPPNVHPKRRCMSTRLYVSRYQGDPPSLASCRHRVIDKARSWNQGLDIAGEYNLKRVNIYSCAIMI